MHASTAGKTLKIKTVFCLRPGEEEEEEKRTTGVKARSSGAVMAPQQPGSYERSFITSRVDGKPKIKVWMNQSGAVSPCPALLAREKAYQPSSTCAR